MTFCDEMKQLKKSLVENNIENENLYKIEVEKEIKIHVKEAVERGFSYISINDLDILLSSYFGKYKLNYNRAFDLTNEVIRNLGLKNRSLIITGWDD